MEEFKPGDVVQLRSGGPFMTVSSVGGEQVTCVWFEKTKQHGGVFNAAAIAKPKPRRPMRVVF
jgi:uncharacterized protein YodC (DUF2158 family)